MKKLLVLSLLLLLNIACSDLKKEADEAEKAGDISTAFEKLNQLVMKESDPILKAQYTERMAILRIKKEIAKIATTKKMSGLEAAIEKTKKDVTAPTAEYQTQFADLMAEVADAYINADAKNNTIKKDNIKKAMEVLNDAMAIAPSSEKAKNKLQEINQTLYSEALTKAEEYQKEYDGAKNKNEYEDKLVYAESYYTKALKYKPDDAELAKKINKLRDHTMAVVEASTNIIFVVGAYAFRNDVYIAKLWIKNNTDGPFEVKIGDYFKIKLDDGSEVSPDPVLCKKAVGGKGQLADANMAKYKEIEGPIAFAAPAGRYPVAIIYNDRQNDAQSKNLPKIN